jgi:phosphoglycerate dehydrogenase-like enzyme
MEVEPIDSAKAPSRLARRSGPPRFYTEVTTLLVSHGFNTVFGPELAAMTRTDGIALELPRGARVVNVARGEVIEQPALVAALQSRHLGGAYLDVFEVEQLPEESPLCEMPNVLITPHNSPASSGNDRRVFEIFRDNLARWSRGEALVNEVLKGNT